MAPTTRASRVRPWAPLTSTRSAPSSPSGTGRGSDGEAGGQAVPAAGAVAGRDPVDAGEGGHQQERLGEGAPVAVEPADGVGEPAQEASGTGAAGDPLALGPLLGPAPAGGLVLAGAGRSADADPGHVDLVDLLEAAGGVGGQDARQSRGEPGAGHDRQARARAAPSSGRSPATSSAESDTETTDAPAARATSARRRWSPAGPARTTAVDGPRTVVRTDSRSEPTDTGRPSEPTTASRRAVSGSTTARSSTGPRARSWRAARAPTAPTPTTTARIGWRSGSDELAPAAPLGTGGLAAPQPDGRRGQPGEGHGQQGASFHDGGASWNRTSDLSLIRAAL